MTQKVAERRPVYAYFVEAPSVDLVKIGRSVNVTKRFEAIRLASPVEVRLLGATEFYTEAYLHKQFSHLRIRGEWFKATQDLREFIVGALNPAPGSRPFYFRIIDNTLAAVHKASQGAAANG